MQPHYEFEAINFCHGQSSIETDTNQSQRRDSRLSSVLDLPPQKRALLTHNYIIYRAGEVAPEPGFPDNIIPIKIPLNQREKNENRKSAEKQKNRKQICGQFRDVEFTPDRRCNRRPNANYQPERLAVEEVISIPRLASNFHFQLNKFS